VGQTSPYNLPYPELADAPNVPSDIQALAVAVNTEFGDLYAALAAILPAAAGHDPLDSGTTASATYTGTRTGGTTPVGASFVAPASGKVVVSWACGLTGSASGTIALCSPRIGTGGSVNAGTEIVAAADSRALQHSGTLEEQQGRSSLFTGLTGGNTYNVALRYRSASGTATITRVEVNVVPMFA
jgi:hypothetical protein